MLTVYLCNINHGLLPADDLMSLLDAGGIHSDHPSVIIDSDAMFNEDMFGYSNLRGRTSGRTRSGNCFTLLTHPHNGDCSFRMYCMLFISDVCLLVSGERDRDVDRDHDRERDSLFRIRERTRWLDSALREEGGLSRLDKDRSDGLLGEPKKTANPSHNPIVFGEELQFWPDRVQITQYPL